MLAGLTQGGREPFVLGDRLGELALGLEDPLLEGPDPLGRVLEPASQEDDLLLQALHLVLEIAHLVLVLGETSIVLCRHDGILPTAASRRHLSRTLPSAPMTAFGFFLATAG